MDRNEALEKTKLKCLEKGHRLLYLTKHGSHLYGTNTEYSDTDYKGIVLPNLMFLAMMNRMDTFRVTENDNSKKNTKDDVDIELYSIQFWLNTLVRKGETEGIELLYSYTNRDAVLYCDPLMEEVFFTKNLLFDPRNTEAFIGFALNQARRYFVKAERFNVLKDIWIFLNGMGELRNGLTLNDVMDEISEQFYHELYCIEDYDENIDMRYIRLCGKIHQGTISLNEFFDRLTREYQKYGHRTIRAAELDSKDWKSLSHALKAIIEVRNLLTSAHISFPFPEQERDLLRDIKLGKVDYALVEKRIMDGIDTVDRLKPLFQYGSWGYNAKHVYNLIGAFYGI